MMPYYIALARGDDETQWIFMFHTVAQANKFVRDASQRKLPEHPAYVGLTWDIVSIKPDTAHTALKGLLCHD